MHGQGDITNIKRSHFDMSFIYTITIDEEIGCRKYVPTSMLSFVDLTQKANKREMSLQTSVEKGYESLIQ